MKESYDKDDGDENNDVENADDVDDADKYDDDNGDVDDNNLEMDVVHNNQSGIERHKKEHHHRIIATPRWKDCILG
jgi:hypothetical protein